MPKITLNRAGADNAGHFCDAGTELTIGDKSDRFTITAERAKQLLDSHGAVGDLPKATKPKPAKPKASKPKAAKPNVPVAALPAAPVEPVQPAGSAAAE